MIRAINNLDIEQLSLVDNQSSPYPCSKKSWEDFFNNTASFGWMIFENATSRNPAGFLICQKALDEVDIVNIAMIPTQRRKGYASLLLKHLIEFSQKNNIKKIFLEVSVNNIPAQKLYSKFNFVSLATRPDYYQIDKVTFADASLMVWHNKILDNSPRN